VGSGYYDDYYVKEDDYGHVTKIMVVDKNIVGAIIGKGGSAINWIQQATGARIQIARGDSGTVTISGTQEQVAAAKSQIQALMQELGWDPV
jgi:polyribonucleotide nucleotidyltransferase